MTAQVLGRTCWACSTYSQGSGIVLLGVGRGRMEEGTLGEGLLPFIHSTNAMGTCHPAGDEGCARDTVINETQSPPSRTCGVASPARAQAAFPSASRFSLVCLLCSSTHLPVCLSISAALTPPGNS